MAIRFGGPHSKSGGQPMSRWEQKRRSKVGARVSLLFLAPLPLALLAFLGPATDMALDMAALGTLLAAAFMTRQGALAQEAYDHRNIARKPAIPRKSIGSVLTGGGLFLASYAPGESLLDPLIYAGLGTVLHGFAFGLDPMKNKGGDGLQEYQSRRVARAVDEAERHLAAMRKAIKFAGEPSLILRVDRFLDAVRLVFRAVEDDPRELAAVRKYLGVYLLGARDAAIKFAELYSRTKDEDALEDFRELLDDLEKNYAAKTEQMMREGRGDLTIEIDVLRERLAREGVVTS